MNRLWVQLTLAFSVIVLVAIGAISVVMNRTTDVEFRQYITRSGMQASGNGVQQLIEYYRWHGSWEGVDSLLAGGVWVSGPVGSGMAMGSGDRMHSQVQGRLDVLLADSRGQVVFDSAGQAEGRALTSEEKAGAVALTLPETGQMIGYFSLSLTGPSARMGGLEQSFLGRIRRVLFAGAALAVGLVLLVVALLSHSLTAPLQRLAAAAREVARGHLGHRVKVEGSAEVAEVGQAFNEMTAALQAAEIQRNDMVAAVAHELRTPLSVLQGNLRAILDGVYELDRTEISHLYDETRLLSRLVEDLRELALADAGQLRLNVRPSDLAQVIRNTVDNMALAAEAQQIALAAQLPESLPAVNADPDRAAQVLRNLLVNALRHTPPGGSVTVRASSDSSTVEIAVADTGEGIAAEDLPHVFERFWRTDPARARDDRFGSGTGLGLSVAQSLVQAQGGRIWVESTQGKGSVFRFTLPVA